MELLLIENQVELLLSKTSISVNEKERRKKAVLNLITEIYNKHQEEISPEEAYEILGFDDE